MVTGFHGLHVLTGVIYLWVMYYHAYNGAYDDGDINSLEIADSFGTLWI